MDFANFMRTTLSRYTSTLNYNIILYQYTWILLEYIVSMGYVLMRLYFIIYIFSVDNLHNCTIHKNIN